MKPRQQVSRAALEFIKTFEGYRQKAAQLPDGRWTIGYGHTLTAREGAEVSASDAEALLLYDLIGVAHAVNEHVYTPLTQNQFDALACFAFNVGVENFRHSAVLRRVNEGQLLQAAYAMEMWRRADFEGERIVIDALVRRRAAEKALFLTPPGGWTVAPTPVLPPKIDFELASHSPREEPTAVRASLEGPLAVVEREDGQVAAPDDDATPTAAEQAAAAVAARLEAIVPEVEPAVTPQPLAEAWEPPTLTEPTLLAPAEFTLSADDGTAVIDQPPLVHEYEARPTPPDPSLFEAPAEADEVVWERAPVAVDRFESTVSLPLVMLGLFGLVIFAGGVFWGIDAAPDPAGGVPAAKMVGWAFGVIGVLCFAAAAYGLLRRLGGDEDEQGKV